MKMFQKITAYGILAFVIVLLDRITKGYVLSACIERIEYNAYMACRLVFNRGITGGLFYADSQTPFVVVSILIAVVTLALFIHAIRRFNQKRCIAGEIMVVAGSVSNLYDRAMYGGVVDFIELSYKSYVWPIFNIADVSIVMGVFLMLYLYRRES